MIIPLCALPECQNQCHVDDNGTVHECCGYTHAMENQRRKALQQGKYNTLHLYTVSALKFLCRQLFCGGDISMHNASILRVVEAYALPRRHRKFDFFG